MLVGEGRISDRDARAAIEAAGISLYADINRVMRWQYATAAATEGHKAEPGDEQPGLPFQSSMLFGSITMHGRTFGFGPMSFTGLLRDVFEQDEPAGVPRRSLADLCMAAGSKIKSIPVEYSFACALAYCMELDGDRAGARRLWEPYALLTPRTWASVEFEPLFLEITGEESPRELVAAEKRAEQALESAIDRGRRAGDPEREYLPLRAMALLQTDAGHVDEALQCYDRALVLMDRFLEPTAKLVLLGDLLWTAIWAGRERKQQEIVNALVRELEPAQSYVANAAIFERCAMLCDMFGDSIAEQKFLSRISPCLELKTFYPQGNPRI